MKTTFLFGTALLLSSFLAHSQTVTTFTNGTPDDGIAVGNDGSIYATNYVGDTVFKFTSSGVMTSFITGLNTPNGIDFNSNGELFVCDGQGNIIYKYDSSGVEIDSYPIDGHPSGIVKSKDDESMIFTRFTGNTINKLETDGTISILSNDSMLNGPVGLGQDENGVLYVGNYNDRIVYKVLTNGDLEYVAQLPTDGGAAPNLGFITYAQGSLWGTVLGNHKIYRINPNAIDDYEIFAGSVQGGSDGDIANATFSAPNGIRFNDAEDIMYVTDFGSKNLRIISGIVLGVNDSDSRALDVIVYTSASRDTLTLRGTIPQLNYTLSLYDLGGKLISRKEETTTSHELFYQLDISLLSKGTYFVEITNSTIQVTKKFIK